MDNISNCLVVEGGNRLYGEVSVHGAKNSALIILAATLLVDGECVLHNCPDLTDISATIKILRHLGCKVKRERDTIIVDARDVERYDIPDDLMREMRSSIIFLGAILGRMSKARLSYPGGCELGPRPIDLHISSLKKLGAMIYEEHGYINCICDSGKLKGSNISLSFPSVGATQNIILSSCTADGMTVINNAAREPEIVDLQNFLNMCGADIKGAGSDTVIINGVKSLHSCEYSVMPDRIVASTFLACAAVTGGEALVTNAVQDHLSAVLPVFEEMGCKIKSFKGHSIHIKATERLNAVRLLRTMPYPGFPTDAQSPFMALAATSYGTSVFIENIFENRFRQAEELVRMGADIKVHGRVAVIEGVKKLHGAQVNCTDLRGGAALVVAALGADGETVITNIRHIDRGYDRIEERLKKLGAKIMRK